MNSLNKYLPNEIIDGVAKKIHESIMLDLNEKIEEAVEMNKNRHMCFTCEMTDDRCGTCWKDFEPEEEFDSWRHFYDLRRSPHLFHVFPVGAYSHTAHGSDNPPFRWCTGASIAPAPASPSTASQLLITSKEGTARGVDLEQ